MNICYFFTCSAPISFLLKMHSSFLCANLLYGLGKPDPFFPPSLPSASLPHWLTSPVPAWLFRPSQPSGLTDLDMATCFYLVQWKSNFLLGLSKLDELQPREARRLEKNLLGVKLTHRGSGVGCGSARGQQTSDIITCVFGLILLKPRSDAGLFSFLSC